MWFILLCEKYGYGIRALIEAQFSRIKRCIGSSVLTEKDSLKKQGVEIVILCCTEIPLVFDKKQYINNCLLVDPTEILATATIDCASRLEISGLSDSGWHDKSQLYWN